MSTRVSIVMPSFNQAAFLDEAIRSVVSQLSKGDEFFVLDGGSTDGSVDIIKQHKDRITHWQSQPDGGQASAIRDGFTRCTGEVIAFLNSDDVYLPGAIDAAREAFDADPGLGFAEGFTVVADAESRIVRCDRRLGPSAAWMRWGYLRVHQPSTFFRRSVYESVGGMDPAYGCVLDTELWYRLLPACRCVRLNRYTAVHRDHEDAKGRAWLDTYEREKKMLDAKYPRYRKRRIKQEIGRIGVNIVRITSGRERAAKRDTAWFMGKRVGEVFPDASSAVCA
ncbi:MAG: glycosyltransferase [Phycisphaerales bacterium]|nr:glycosyltransferase [Phycisphaerales bacterium]